MTKVNEPQLIPTRNRSKIPHTLSYPVGAKIISEALFGVPQFLDLTVDFSSRNTFAQYHGTGDPLRVIEARYAGPRRFFLASEGWQVRVHAVPQGLRNLIKNKIVLEALPSIRLWLLANPHSRKREGEHWLAFSYDELMNELTCQEDASIEWQTARVDWAG